ncbi:lipopolysaccharide biosynthesis protein [Propionicicella superfundia]|uniref:lipopolysaccharide biosynthesis protein n=1 Tax=Propionicicella superfundia TaxID=348582 RepID=UPI00041C0809|nr:polysaccharide biosynthesis C-terminal domain-containing protein [Propionicicella superfundia]
MTRAPTRRGDAAVLVGGQLVAAGGAFAVNLLAARAMSPAQRGELAFALQIAYFATVFALTGLERPYISTRSGPFPDHLRRFVSLVLPGIGLVAPLTGVLVGAIPTLAGWLVGGAVLVAAYVALNALSRSVRAAFLVSGERRWFVSNAVFTQVVIVAGAVVLVVLRVANPVVWMALYTLSGLAPLLILGLALRRPAAAVDGADVRVLRRRGLKLLVSDLGNTAMLRSDRLLLPLLGSAAQLGLYVTVATVMEMATWPVQQWVDASLRTWTKEKTGPLTLLRRIVLPALGLTAATAVLLGGICYVLVVLVLPASYRPSLQVVVPLGLAAVIYAWTRVQQGILISAGVAGRVTVAELSGMAASIAGYVVFIPEWGMGGAAAGSILGYAVCGVVGALFLRQVSSGTSAVGGARRTGGRRVEK